MRYPSNYELYQASLKYTKDRPDCKLAKMFYETASRLMEVSKIGAPEQKPNTTEGEHPWKNSTPSDTSRQ